MWLTVTSQQIEHQRLDDLTRFYSLLDRLEKRFRGKRRLRELAHFEDWPPRGVYFFFERSENRSNSGKGLRVVRVGTHGLAVGVGSTVYKRLRQHRGTVAGGGNHRASIFRLLVGQALLAQGEASPCTSWSIKPIALACEVLGCSPDVVLRGKAPIERAVSDRLADMPLLVLGIDDRFERGFIERNSIALLSNYQRKPLDLHTIGWLGCVSSSAFVVGSGLWNQQHVEKL